MSRLSKYATTVILFEKIPTEKDEFNHINYVKNVIEVKNCLVMQNAFDQVITSNQLETIHKSYTIAIPKGNKNNWENQEVSFIYNGHLEKCRTIGTILEAPEIACPFEWDMQIRAEAYE